jgi:hypothetical protein
MNSSIASSASRLRAVIVVVASLVLLMVAAAQLGMPASHVYVDYRAHGAGAAAARAIAGGTLLLLAVALVRLVQMLGRIAAGETFSASVVRRFRGFAFWLLIMAIFGFLAPLLTASIAPAAGGVHRIEIVLDLRQLLLLAITMLLFLVARLLERARDLESEIREFV